MTEIVAPDDPGAFQAVAFALNVAFVLTFPASVAPPTGPDGTRPRRPPIR